MKTGDKKDDATTPAELSAINDLVTTMQMHGLIQGEPSPEARARFLAKAAAEPEYKGINLVGTEDEIIEQQAEEIERLRAEVRAAKANVRDACATACAEVEAAANADQYGDGSIYRARGAGAQACIDAIAALDLEAL